MSKEIITTPQPIGMLSFDLVKMFMDNLIDLELISISRKMQHRVKNYEKNPFNSGDLEAMYSISSKRVTGFFSSEYKGKLRLFFNSEEAIELYIVTRFREPIEKLLMETMIEKKNIETLINITDLNK